MSLSQRAHNIADGFSALGKDFAADLTRGFADSLDGGAPDGLYRHWIDQQAARLAGLVLELAA